MLDTAMEREATDGLNLRLSIACNTAVPFMLFGMALDHMSSSPLTALLWCVAGLVSYSFVEYAFHRGVMHRMITEGHHLHHVEPFAAHAMPFSTGLCGHTAMLVLFSLCIGLDFALCITLGNAIGYALYCQLHELIHQDPGLARRLMPPALPSSYAPPLCGERIDKRCIQFRRSDDLLGSPVFYLSLIMSADDVIERCKNQSPRRRRPHEGEMACRQEAVAGIIGEGSPGPDDHI